MTATPSEAVETTAAQEPKPKSAKAKTTAEPTEYVVLRRGEGDLWGIVASDIRARSGNEAIRQVLGVTEGVHVAVPARSWKPVTVRAEVQTRLKLESA